MKILSIFQRKRIKTYALMVPWAAAIRFWRLLYLGTGEKIRANRERGDILYDLISLYLFSFSAHRLLRFYTVNAIFLFVYIFNIFLYCNELEFRPVYIVESLEM